MSLNENNSFTLLFNDMVERTLTTMFNYKCCGQRHIRLDKNDTPNKNYPTSLKEGRLRDVMEAILQEKPGASGYDGQYLERKMEETPEAPRAAILYSNRVAARLLSSQKGPQDPLEVLTDHAKLLHDSFTFWHKQSNGDVLYGHCCRFDDGKVEYQVNQILQRLGAEEPQGFDGDNGGYEEALKRLMSTNQDTHIILNTISPIMDLLNRACVSEMRGMHTTLNDTEITL
ncbi:MAG: hypothetical protein H6861_01685 [Rhodospirillales bacterium]|nr:hypothetical protein [Rhodospirillales bacterium]